MMGDLTFMLLALAMVVLWLAMIWYFIRTVIVMGRQSVLLGVLGFCFSPIAQLIYYVVNKDRLNLGRVFNSTDMI